MSKFVDSLCSTVRMTPRLTDAALIITSCDPTAAGSRVLPLVKTSWTSSGSNVAAIMVGGDIFEIEREGQEQQVSTSCIIVFNCQQSFQDRHAIDQGQRLQRGGRRLW